MGDQEDILKSIDIEDLSKKTTFTKAFTLGGKSLSLTYFITSCHQYTDDPNDPGYDWYFIQQTGSLNGNNDYKKEWAGSFININNESFFVGQGEVCLKYVDYYAMKNHFNNDDICADLIFSNPQAINGETQYSFAKDLSFGGNFGFESESSSLTLGVNFSSSYGFSVKDCKCVQDYQDEKGGIGWNYSFRKAHQNTALGHWQELHSPANLATSTFCPTNLWIWRIPTSKRHLYHSFTTDFEISLMNTISRASGSQSPKNIKENLSNKIETIEVPLTFPPLISANLKTYLFSNEKSSKVLHIACEDDWHVVNDSEIPSWLKLNKLVGSGQDTPIVVSVDNYNDEESNNIREFDIVFTRNNSNDEQDKVVVKISQSPGKLVS